LKLFPLPTAKAGQTSLAYNPMKTRPEANDASICAADWQGPRLQELFNFPADQASTFVE